MTWLEGKPGRKQKGGPREGCLDRLRGLKRPLVDSAHPANLGAAGPDPDLQVLVQLEADVLGRGARLPPDGSRARTLLGAQSGAWDTLTLIGFLRQLRRHFRGQEVVLRWDGLPSHRSTEMKAFLAAQTHWLEVVRLPAYAPELNPVEGMWSYLQGHPPGEPEHELH